VISLRIRIAQTRSALLASAVVALGAGCEAGYTGGAGASVYAESPQGGDGVAVAAGPTEVDGDLVYDPQPPVADIETYPSVMYGGVAVYFVGDRWYRRGPNGWGYFRSEPPELARQREMHDRDPRWAQARQAPMRPGVAEPQAPERSPMAPGAEAPRGPVAPAAKAEDKKKDDTTAPAPKRKPVPRRAPRPAPAHEGEH
jgi:hypothetical protein